MLNNLLENREMHLEDGRLLIPAARYDALLAEHGADKMEQWRLVRVSEDFRVIALGLPVPRYVGSPLDPPLRSRFQARDVKHLSYGQQLEVMARLGPNIDKETLASVLSFSHTLVTEESAGLGLLDFPIENLPSLVSLLNQVPTLDVHETITKLYLYKLFLLKGGQKSVEDTTATAGSRWRCGRTWRMEARTPRATWAPPTSSSLTAPGRAACVLVARGAAGRRRWSPRWPRCWATRPRLSRCTRT